MAKYIRQKDSDRRISSGRAARSGQFRKSKADRSPPAREKSYRGDRRKHDVRGRGRIPRPPANKEND